jgi:hypothetical protein
MPLGYLPGDLTITANRVSGDGSVVVVDAPLMPRIAGRPAAAEQSPTQSIAVEDL